MDTGENISGMKVTAYLRLFVFEVKDVWSSASMPSLHLYCCVLRHGDKCSFMPGVNAGMLSDGV
jgi:hypothetical protein